MGRMQIYIDDEVERQFRIWLATAGKKKGDISKEIEKMIKGAIYMHGGHSKQKSS